MQHNFTSPPHGPLAPQRLEAFESKLGSRLPPEYRAYLLTHNGAVPEGQDRLEVLYGLHEGPPYLCLDVAYRWDSSIVKGTQRRPVPIENLLPVADVDIGAWCLAFRGRYTGQIFLWENESDFDGRFPITRYAKSLSDFFDRLAAETAIETGNLGVLEAYLADGRPVDAPFLGKETLLENAICALTKRAEVLQFLLDKGANWDRAAKNCLWQHVKVCLPLLDAYRAQRRNSSPS